MYPSFHSVSSYRACIPEIGCAVVGSVSKVVDVVDVTVNIELTLVLLSVLVVCNTVDTPCTGDK